MRSHSCSALRDLTPGPLSSEATNRPALLVVRAPMTSNTAPGVFYDASYVVAYALYSVRRACCP
jgi:hypothetical protein